MKKLSKKRKELQDKIGNREYSIDEAIKLLKETAKVKFDASAEAHVRLGIDPKKPEQSVRATVSLPHGTGKKIKIAVFVGPDKVKEVKEAGADIVGGVELVEEIKKTEKCDFDISVATPDMMRHLGKIGKILGTRGLMPNPKTDTVSPDPVKTVKSLLSGKVAFKSDEGGNLHQIIGKVSFDEKKLKENFEIFIKAVRKAKPEGIKGVFIKNVVICSTMGPAIKIAI